MEVRCKNNNGVENTLKLGKVYPVEKEFVENYKIELKKGTFGTYLRNRFERVEEQMANVKDENDFSKWL